MKNLKIYTDKKIFKNSRFKLAKMCAIGTIAVSLLSSCSSNVDNTVYNEVILEPNEHKIVQVVRNMNLWIGKNEKIGIIAPSGYYIVDYDYDKTEDFEYQDFVYANKASVTIKNPNEFGIPVEKVDERTNNVYQPGEHVVADIQRNINLWVGKNETKHIVPPEGYKVLDYDYDKNEDFEFETYMYVNEVPVKVNDVNNYGTPIEKITTNKSTIYQIGKHVIVDIKRNINLWIGKDEIKQITAPKGYKIVDYDYDKTDNFEFETIVYENIVPVEVKNKDQLGTPLGEVAEVQNTNSFDAGQHILVEIDRSLNMWLGKNGKERLIDPKGYETIDYDYDKNEDFEFVTRVYSNTIPVITNSVNDFGVPNSDNKVYKKTLVK